MSIADVDRYVREIQQLAVARSTPYDRATIASVQAASGGIIVFLSTWINSAIGADASNAQRQLVPYLIFAIAFAFLAYGLTLWLN